MNHTILYTFDQESCIMCGAPIPEGRQVCINCENAIYARESIPHSQPLISPTNQKSPDER